MRGSALPPRYFSEDYTTDSGDMFRLSPQHDLSNEWLLSSPSPLVISKMHLSKPLPRAPQSPSRAPLNSRRATKHAMAGQFPSQSRRSTESNSSNPGMTEDPSGSSDSDTSLEEDSNYHASAAELWDSFWTPASQYPLGGPIKRVETITTPSTRTQHSNLSSEKRNLGSTNLAQLDVAESPTRVLHRADRARLARRSPNALQTLHETTYSPFPPVSPSRLHPTRPTHIPHQSYPTRIDSRANRPQLRSRAHTTPSQFNVANPSTHSPCAVVCSPSNSSASSTPLHMRPAPVSPQFAPPLMELMEKSVFDDDDDDEEEMTGLEALASRLHIRSGSSNDGSGRGKGSSPRPKRRSLRKSASAAFKGVFGMKK